jgi:hypothetical protein
MRDGLRGSIQRRFRGAISQLLLQYTERRTEQGQLSPSRQRANRDQETCEGAVAHVAATGSLFASEVHHGMRGRRIDPCLRAHPGKRDNEDGDAAKKGLKAAHLCQARGPRSRGFRNNGG